MKARQLSSTPKLHRDSVLQSIATRNHQDAAQIMFLKTDAARVDEELSKVPEDTNSRLDWINRQLHGV